MAAVWLAEDIDTAELRAVKILSPEATPRDTQRFDVEGQAMQAVSHPHVIRVFDHGHDRGRAFIVMELAEGGSPVDWLARHGAMPPQLAVNAVLQVCSGLDHIHHMGLVHRDVKPENILVMADGTCKIGDLGIVLAHEQLQVTDTGVLLGSLGFMSPEQRRAAQRVTPAADQYALAGTLHTLLTDRIEMDRFAFDTYPEIFFGVPEVLVAPLRRAFSYDPASRFPSMLDFGAALEDAVSTLPADPDPTPSLVIPAVFRRYANAAPKRRGASPGATVEKNDGRKTILVAEDDPSLRLFVRMVLENHGYNVLIAKDGLEAVRLADEFIGPLHAVLTDLVMPGQSGAQVAAGIRRTRPEAGILLMTSQAVSSLIARGALIDAELCVQKPFTPQVLLKAIDRAVDLHAGRVMRGAS